MKISSIAFIDIAIISPLRFVVCGRSSPNQLKYRCHSSLCVWPNRGMGWNGLGWCELEGWQMYMSDQKMCVPRCHDNRSSVSCLFIFGFFSLICGEHFGAIFFGLCVCCFHEWTFSFIFITFTQYCIDDEYSVGMYKYVHTYIYLCLLSPHNYFGTNGRMSLYTADTDIIFRSWFRFCATLNHCNVEKMIRFFFFFSFSDYEEEYMYKVQRLLSHTHVAFFLFLFYLWKNDFSS